eukprot:COSAG01_NODE_26611_length_708_cov_1.305419_1_plen_191_part_10
MVEEETTSPKLRRVYKYEKGIGDHGAEALGQALEEMPKPLAYTAISLCNSGLSSAGVRSLACGLRLGYGGKYHQAVHALQRSNSYMGGGGMGGRLEELWLNGNPFGGDENVETVRALAEALPDTLKALGLYRVGLGDAGLRALLPPDRSALPRLQVLDLTNNELEAHGFEALGKVQPNFAALRTLRLYGNR